MAKNTDKKVIKANTTIGDVSVGDVVTVMEWTENVAKGAKRAPKHQAAASGEVLELRPSSKNRTIVVLRQAHGSTTRYMPSDGKVFRAKS